MAQLHGILRGQVSITINGECCPVDGPRQGMVFHQQLFEIDGGPAATFPGVITAKSVHELYDKVIAWAHEQQDRLDDERAMTERDERQKLD